MRRVAIWSGCRCGYRLFGVGNGDGLFATVASWSVAVEFNRWRLSSTATVVGVVDYIWVRHCWLGFVELFLIRVLCGMCRSVYCLVRDEILAFNGLGWTETLSLGSNLEAQWQINPNLFSFYSLTRGTCIVCAHVNNLYNFLLKNEVHQRHLVDLIDVPKPEPDINFAKKSKYHRWSACWCCTLKIFLSL